MILASNAKQKSAASDQKSTRVQLALIVLLAIAFKGLLLAFDAVPFNGDEAVVALMARHILAGERPVFFYGQAYLGSTDAWLIALSFSIFGQSVLAIRLVQIALFAATLITTYFVARRFGLSAWAARLATLLLALPAPMLTLYTTATIGGYGETLLFGNVLILLMPIGQPLSRWLIFGLVAGFAFYTFPLVLIYLVPIIMQLLYQLIALRRSRPWRFAAGAIGLTLLGAAIGSAPWWSVLLQSGGLPIAEMTGSAVANTVAAPTFMQSLGVRLIDFFVFGLSAWFGLRYPWSGDLILPGLGLLALVTVSAGIAFILMRGLQKTARLRGVRLFELAVLATAFSIALLNAPAIPGLVRTVTPVLGVIVLIVYAAALIYAVKRGPKLLWGMIATLLITFLITPFGGDPSGRYFLPLYLPLVIFTAMMLQWIRNEKVTFVRLLIVVILGYNGVATLIAAGQPPGITTQFDATTWIDHARDRELIELLLVNGETRGYTNYWSEYTLAFLSNEQIVTAARLPYHHDMSYTRRDDRYLPYSQAVDQASRAFYLTTNHPQLDRLIRDRLTSLGVAFKEYSLGNYHLFYALSRKVEPGELGNW